MKVVFAGRRSNEYIQKLAQGRYLIANFCTFNFYTKIHLCSKSIFDGQILKKNHIKHRKRQAVLHVTLMDFLQSSGSEMKGDVDCTLDSSFISNSANCSGIYL